VRTEKDYFHTCRSVRHKNIRLQLVRMVDLMLSARFRRHHQGTCKSSRSRSYRTSGTVQCISHSRSRLDHGRAHRAHSHSEAQRAQHARRSHAHGIASKKQPEGSFLPCSFSSSGRAAVPRPTDHKRVRSIRTREAGYQYGPKAYRTGLWHAWMAISACVRRRLCVRQREAARTIARQENIKRKKETKITSLALSRTNE
jgi:hypothetical protein